MARTVAKDFGEKRHHILKTAAKVFAEEGYDRASVSQVAKACEISKANIYHYYSSKDDLLFAILESYLRDLRDHICGLSLADLSPPKRLQTTISEVLLAYEGADDEHKVQAMGIETLSADRQDILKGYQRDLVGFVATIVREVAPDAFTDDDAKLRATTMAIFGMMNWFYMWNTTTDAAARMAYADIVSKLSLHGIEGLQVALTDRN